MADAETLYTLDAFSRGLPSTVDIDNVSRSRRKNKANRTIRKPRYQTAKEELTLIARFFSTSANRLQPFDAWRILPQDIPQVDQGRRVDTQRFAELPEDLRATIVCNRRL